MRCPNCSNEKTRVRSTIASDEVKNDENTSYVVRRRKCEKCGYNFPTTERPGNVPKK